MNRRIPTLLLGLFVVTLGCVASQEDMTPGTPADPMTGNGDRWEDFLPPEDLAPETETYGRDGRLSSDPDDPDSRNEDGAEGLISGRVAGGPVQEVPGTEPGLEGGGGGGAGVPWTCPPTITASASCAGDFQPGSANCSAQGRLTAAGVARSRQCNSAPSASTECGFYLSLRQCMSDCSACQQNRLVGYYQTCRNMGQSAIGDLTNAPRSYGSCQSLCDFQTYVSGMRRCLQRQATALRDNWNRDYSGQAVSCGGLVNGPRDNATGRRDLNAGIIGSHTYCNQANNFCALSNAARQCFGAGLGNSWAGLCLGPGGHSPWGSWQSVGMCHLFAQAAECATTGPVTNFIDSLCQGYQDGCMTAPSCAYMPKRIACMLACPRSRDIALLVRVLNSPLLRLIPGANLALVRQFMNALGGVFRGNPGNVAAMESLCEQVIGRDVAPGISCENPSPPPVRCCCRQPSGQATAYTSPATCTANNGRAGNTTMTVDWGSCNQRGWTVADCNGAPPPSRPADPAANPFCYSSTLGRTAANGTCIQSAIDRLWYQCGQMVGWQRAPALPGGDAGPFGPCTSRVPLPR